MYAKLYRILPINTEKLIKIKVNNLLNSTHKKDNQTYIKFIKKSVPTP